MQEINDNLFGFTIDYEADARDSYFVLRRAGLRKQGIIEFQVEMIQHNRIPGILMLEVREKDLEIDFYYKTTGLMSLTNYFKRQKISKPDFIGILDKLISALLHSKNYFLNDSSFILDEDLIYINPTTKEIFVPYIPLHIRQDIRSTCLRFILNILINKAQISTSDNFVQEVLTLLKEDGFNLLEFLQALKGLEGEQLGKESSGNPPGYVRSNKDCLEHNNGIKDVTVGEMKNKPVGEIKSKFRTETENKTENQLQENSWNRAGNGFGNKIEDRNQIEIQNEIQNEMEKKLKNTIKEIPLRTKVLGVLAIFVVLSVAGKNISKALMIIMGPKIPLLLISLALAAVLIVLAMTRYKGMKAPLQTLPFNEVSRFTSKFEGEQESRLNVSKQLLGFRPAKLETAASSDSSFFSEQVKDYMNSRIEEAALDDTLLLEEVDYPFFQSANGIHKILVDKNPIILGRNAETCDQIIESPQVGRIHAEIRYLEGVCYLIDLDSRNGTFVNGQKLISNKETVINDRDRISFAGAEYIFYNS